MTGKEIYNRDAVEYSEYASLLQTLRLQLGEDALYSLLEKAESKGKKIAINENAEVTLFEDDINKSSIIFV